MAQKKVDVLIIGSGHTGGMAAKILTEKGIACTMLDAGPMLNFEKYRELKPASQLPFRGLGTPGRNPHIYQSSEFNENQWVDEKVIPYTHPADQVYNWVRVRSVGGRSPFWVASRSATATSSSRARTTTASARTGRSSTRT